MIYYLLGDLPKFDEKTLLGFLTRNGVYNNIFTCRESLNRAISTHCFNMLVASEHSSDQGPFNSSEVLGNRENLQKLLQTILDINGGPDKTTITVGNRFFCWTPTTRFPSPVGSLISGILKTVLKITCNNKDYEEFKDELINKTANAGSYLSDTTTTASLAMCIKMFSEYKMPEDPDSSFRTYGTCQYLSSIRNKDNFSTEERTKLWDYFTTINGIHPSNKTHLFRKD